jgi:hypothetical protein
MTFLIFIFWYTVVINSIATLHDVDRHTFKCQYFKICLEKDNIIIITAVLLRCETIRLECNPLEVCLQYTRGI